MIRKLTFEPGSKVGACAVCGFAYEFENDKGEGHMVEDPNAP